MLADLEADSDELVEVLKLADTEADLEADTELDIDDDIDLLALTDADVDADLLIESDADVLADLDAEVDIAVLAATSASEPSRSSPRFNGKANVFFKICIEIG